MTIFEAWEDDGDITFAPQASIVEHKEKGLLSTEAKLLHRIEADTFEDAIVAHDKRMGWATDKK